MGKKNAKIKPLVEVIKNKFDEYDRFVSTNLDQDKTYFEEKIRQENLKAILNVINLKLDEIILVLYGCGKYK